MSAYKRHILINLPLNIRSIELFLILEIVVYSNLLILQFKLIRHLKFANKVIDAIDINNILHHKDVTKSIPAYFQHQSAPKISFAYTRQIESKKIQLQTIST